MRERLILHADDLGMTPAITATIAAAWREGLLDGFSVLANGTGLEALAAHLAAAPERPCRVIVHLNLHEGPPVADPDAVPLLLDAQGHLRNGFLGLWARWLFGGAATRAALLAQVELEWRAQIARVLEVGGGRVCGVDGHVHVHMLPFLFGVAARLAREHDLPEIRISREPLHVSGRAADSLTPAFAVNLIKFGVLRVCAAWAVPVARREGLTWPEAFVGVLYTGRMTAASARAGAAAAPDQGRVEVLFHVGRADPAEAHPWSPGGGGFSLSPLRDLEHAELVRFCEDLDA